MRAAYYDSFGTPDVIIVGDLPCPELRPGEVLVRVAVSGINPSDVKRRSGWGNAAWAGRRIVPHCDGAGEAVKAADEAGTEWVGRRVWIWSTPGRTFARDHLEYGTAAALVAVPIGNLAMLPDCTDYATGACLGVPAITAHYAVFADGPVADKTLLVQGGGGAVGEAAIRMAKHAGAQVFATVRSPARAEIALAAGADRVFDLNMPDACDEVREAAPDGIDRLIEVDFGANVDFSAKIVAIGGTIVSYSSTSVPRPEIPYYDLQRKAVVIRLVSNYVLTRFQLRNAVEHITSMLEHRALSATIAKRFPIEDIVQAHRAVEAGVLGKVVLEMSSG
jgi:NADPH2:quinone reductase